jgi:methionyl-tRNA formyltransferase
MSKIKIFIVTQEEPFYLPLGLAKLIEAKKENIVGTTILPRFNKKKSKFKILKELFLLYGFKSFAIQGFEFFIFKFLNILTSIISLKRFYSVKKIFKNFSIPIIPTKNINDSDYIEKLKTIKPDLIISFACTQIFKDEILSIPKLGCINVHGSLLPKYRGRNIGFWVLLNQETETGVTVHYMNEKIDAGEVILQKKIQIAKNETIHTLYKKILPLEGLLLIEAINLIENNTINSWTTQIKKEDYFSDASVEDIKKFRKLGKKFR